MKKRDVIIIGGGPAGRVIVHSLHTQKAGMSVALIKNEEINVNRCAIPYGIPDTKPIEKFVVSNKLVTDFGAELIVDEVVKIEPSKREVYTQGGETYAYNHLVLATGSRPLVPPIPGVETSLITPVRTLENLSRLREYAAKHKKAVIIGGGYIGIEMAVVLRQMGLEVTIVEMLPKVLLATTEPEFIGEVEKTLTENGLQLLTNRKVVEFAAHNGGDLDVILDGGDAVSANFAILSVGVVPNIELAVEAGLKTSRLGIQTDQYMRTSEEHIYAAGDCVEKISFVTGEPTRGEFGTNAVFMAKVVAQNILGKDKVFPGIINASATSVYDWSLGAAGLTEKMAQESGIDTLTGYSEILDKYPMMKGVSPIRTKLVFDRNTGRLVGGSVLQKGEGAAQNADFISFAIQMKATLEDLLTCQYATHPELAAKPSDNTYVFAARDALAKK
ncbi:MAG: FAD-dependent oxidoreductase [Deltaproteobacteria bacterium]|nr:FAD-dependent oxidoreductase [Deltaproteobacteria bacterium]